MGPMDPPLWESRFPGGTPHWIFRPPGKYDEWGTSEEYELLYGYN
jgi:hypothetical protein